MSDEKIREGFALLGLSYKYLEKYDDGEKFGEKIMKDCMMRNYNNDIIDDKCNKQKGGRKTWLLGEKF